MRLLEVASSGAAIGGARRRTANAVFVFEYRDAACASCYTPKAEL